MKLHCLRYFVVLADELHFGRAADRLFITQPPLSLAIKGLEEELGVMLLLRTSKQVELTPAGRAFLDEARFILARLGRAGDVARAVASGVRGRIDIGMAGSLVYRGVPAIVKRFNQCMPDIDVVLREMSSGEQLQALLQGQLTAGFVNAAVVPSPLQSLPLAGDEFVLCLPDGHPRANDACVRLADLRDEHFVMFSRDIAPAHYDNVIAIFNRAGIHPRTVHAARVWLTVVAMVGEGLGVSVVPRTLSRLGAAGVRFAEIEGEPVATAALFVWNPAFVGSLLESFIACARQSLQPCIDPYAR